MSTQASIDWNPPGRPAPAAADPSAPAPVRRRVPRVNRDLVERLVAGPVDSDELDGRHLPAGAPLPFGKRYSARLDVRKWLREAGYEGDPIPRRTLDPEANHWEWRLTPAARELALQLLHAEDDAAR